MSENTPPPMPPKAQRGLLRWVLLLLNGGALAGMMLAYPHLSTSAPALLEGSMAWLMLTAWGLFVLVHLLMVCVLEARETVMHYGQQRAYKKQLSAYNRQRIKQRLESS